MKQQCVISNGETDTQHSFTAFCFNMQFLSFAIFKKI